MQKNKNITIIERCAMSTKQDYIVAEILHQITRESDLLRIDNEHKECYYFDIDDFSWKVDANARTIFAVLTQLFCERAEKWYNEGSIDLSYKIGKVMMKFYSVAYRKKILGIKM